MAPVKFWETLIKAFPLKSARGNPRAVKNIPYLHGIGDGLQVGQAVAGQILAGGGKAPPDRTVAGELLKAGIEGLDDQRSVIADLVDCLEEFLERHQAGPGDAAVIFVYMDVA